MRGFLLGSLALAVLPEIVRLINDERGRKWAREEEDRQRRHDAEQRAMDRENALEVARIEASSETE